MLPRSVRSRWTVVFFFLSQAKCSDCLWSSKFGVSFITKDRNPIHRSLLELHYSLSSFLNTHLVYCLFVCRCINSTWYHLIMTARPTPLNRLSTMAGRRDLSDLRIPTITEDAEDVVGMWSPYKFMDCFCPTVHEYILLTTCLSLCWLL